MIKMLLSCFLKKKARNKIKFFILFPIALILTLQISFADMRSPYQSKPQKISNDFETSPTKAVFGGLVWFYSKIISPADGPRSPSYPTGSAYGFQAIQQEGFLMGTLLIGDRLLHEADKPQGGFIYIYGRKRYYDPIENNTFWWKK